MSTSEHRELAKGQSATCAVLTVSDTRTVATDKGGAIIADLLAQAGHRVAECRIVPDEPADIQAQLRAWLQPDLTARGADWRMIRYEDVPHAPDVIISTGGTGIARRDTTIEVVERLLDKKLEGFGELFRMLSWREIASAAMLSRAVAGLAGETLIFALPGSTNAVELAMSKLIIPELPHLIWERRR